MTDRQTMTTLHVTRGLPASGKSSWARQWVRADPARRVRVNRDCLRDMLWAGAYERGPAHEAAVTAAQHAAVAGLLTAGWDVAVDDMNLDPAVMAAWHALAVQAGARVEVVDFTAVSVETCVRRDAVRPDSGRCVMAPGSVRR